MTAIRLAGVLAGLMIYAMSVRSQVTYDRILNAAHEPGSWLTYSGDYKKAGVTARSTRSTYPTLAI